jgi:hypothetical protein
MEELERPKIYNLKEAAKLAWEQEQYETELAHRKRRQEEWEKILKKLADWGIDVSGAHLHEIKMRPNNSWTNTVVAVQGLIFDTVYHEYHTYLRVITQCPTCQEYVEHQVSDLADIGEVLENPRKHHYCTPRPSVNPPSTEERLIEVIRDFIAENMPEQ